MIEKQQGDIHKFKLLFVKLRQSSFRGGIYKKLGGGKVNYLKKDTVNKAQDETSVSTAEIEKVAKTTKGEEHFNTD